MHFRVCAMSAEASLLKHRIDRLEQAARAGNAQAKIDFAIRALQDMWREDIPMRPDEVERRRKFVGEQLQGR